jgi:7-carboxy-7-deazaguanine synthase
MDGTLGGRYGSAEALVDVLEKEWAGDRADRFVVLTGGEPLLQVDGGLVQALHDRGFEIALETNGTVELPAAVDWICVSPKTPEPLKIRSGNELKLVYPQADLRPEAFVDLDFRRFSLQPMDGADVVENTRQAIAYCLAHPKWQLSLQTHKYLGIR